MPALTAGQCWRHPAALALPLHCPGCCRRRPPLQPPPRTPPPCLAPCAILIFGCWACGCRGAAWVQPLPAAASPAGVGARRGRCREIQGSASSLVQVAARARSRSLQGVGVGLGWSRRWLRPGRIGGLRFGTGRAGGGRVGCCKWWWGWCSCWRPVLVWVRVRGRGWCPGPAPWHRLRHRRPVLPLLPSSPSRSLKPQAETWWAPASAACARSEGITDRSSVLPCVFADTCPIQYLLAASSGRSN